MYFYFLSEYPAVIKFRGIYYGTMDGSVKFCNFDPPYPLVEICPLLGSSGNFAFFPDDKFLAAPPENVSVTDLKGGYFLRFTAPFYSGDFRIIEQAKFRDAVITAFFENGYKISLETQSGFFAETLAFAPINATFTRGEGVNSDLIFATFDCEKKKILNVYSVSDPALAASEEISDFGILPNGFFTTTQIKDIAKHSVTKNYSVSGKEIKEISRSVEPDALFDREKITEKILPYAFCEEFLCGGDYSFYLAENVKENAEKLAAFFGAFIGVTTPPLFRDYREIGLIKKIAERKYSVDYFTFDVENNKITNINKI